MIFMKMHLILNSFEDVCDKNPLFKIQSVLCERLAINHSAEQFGLPQSAVITGVVIECTSRWFEYLYIYI